MTEHIGGEAGGAEGSVATPPPHVLMPKNTFTVVFDKTYDIGNFRARAHFLPLDDAQELSKKHNEAGPPEQPPADGLSSIGYGHTRQCEN